MRCSVLQSLERHYNNFSLSRELFLLILNVKSPPIPQPTSCLGWKLDTIELSLVFM